MSVLSSITWEKITHHHPHCPLSPAEDPLRAFPPWAKTKLPCPVSHLYPCKGMAMPITSGKNLSYYLYPGQAEESHTRSHSLPCCITKRRGNHWGIDVLIAQSYVCSTRSAFYKSSPTFLKSILKSSGCIVSLRFLRKFASSMSCHGKHNDTDSVRSFGAPRVDGGLQVWMQA